jgi:hypothetical protein
VSSFPKDNDKLDDRSIFFEKKFGKNAPRQSRKKRLPWTSELTDPIFFTPKKRNQRKTRIFLDSPQSPLFLFLEEKNMECISFYFYKKL